MREETILCVATRAWDSLWRDSQQVMSRIAKDNRVLYFEPGRNPDHPIGSEFRRNWPNLISLRHEDVQRNLTVIQSPPSLPLARGTLPPPILRVTTPLIVALNVTITVRHIRGAINKLGVRSPILWLYDPKQVGLVGKFGEKLVCYFNYDEYAEFDHNKRIHDLIRQLDNHLTRRADVVFATSRGQSSRRQKLNPETHLIPNGIDFDLFHRALEPQTPMAADIAHLKPPLIGFVGWLGYQIDVELLIKVAEECADCSIVLVGPDCLPDETQRRRLHQLANVSFLGQKPVAKLPEYLKALDVALIPYRIGGHTLTVYPLKLHEYLAAGRPIVATPLPELRAFSRVVRIAETPSEYIRQIREAIQDHSPAAVEARVGVARENTWDQRVVEIYRVLDHRLSRTSEEYLEEHIHRLDPVQPPKRSSGPTLWRDDVPRFSRTSREATERTTPVQSAGSGDLANSPAGET